MGYDGSSGCNIYSGLGENVERVLTGKIIKGIAGFYYVYAADNNVYECKAKGSFRKNGIKPLIGDNVEIDVISVNETDKTAGGDDEFSQGNIVTVLDRTNCLIRPEVSNIDQALVVVALTNPEPNFLMLDKLLLQFVHQEIPVILCFNKTDLASEETVKDAIDMYKGSGHQLIVTSAEKNIGISELKELLKGKVTAIAGPSGVGKSSIINSLQSGVTMETGGISEKLKRGKHTTRHSQIIPLDLNSFIIDTPGFTSMDVFDIQEDNLKDYYEEFSEYTGCYFSPCFHIHEPKCEVKTALENKKINKRRYENYIHIFDEIKRSRKY